MNDSELMVATEALLAEMLACGCATRISDDPEKEFRFTEGRPACGVGMHVAWYDMVAKMSGTGPEAN